MRAIFWTAVRPWIRFRTGRRPPERMPKSVWYFAFGSNMNEYLFRRRRHMKMLETRIARLDGYRLRFAVAGGRRPGISAPADIVEAPGHSVHGVLYRLPLRKFARLDASEGYQYEYLWTEVVDENGDRIPAVTFKVARDDVPEGRPSSAYMRLLREAARQRGLPSDYVEFLDRVETAS